MLFNNHRKKACIPYTNINLKRSTLGVLFFFLLIIESPSVETCQKLGKHFFADVS